MKILITSSLILLSFQIGISQTYTFSVGLDLGASSARSFDILKEETVNYIDVESLPDTILIQANFRETTSYDKALLVFSGGHANINLNWKLKKSFEIETGIGYRYSEFGYSTPFGSSQIEILNQDTIDYTSNLLQTIELGCNPNSNFQFREFPNYINNEIFIPFKIAYTVWEGDIKLMAGGMLSTTIKGIEQSSTHSQGWSFENQHSQCTYYSYQESIPVNHLYRTVNLATNFGIEFWMLRYLGIQISAEKRMTNLLKNKNLFEPSYQNELGVTANSKPSYYSLTLKYAFNRK